VTITAKIVADSISEQGIRLTTMQLRYPKFIHGEFMTHRVFSRNASSSRAIPVERLIQDIIDDPAMFIFWGKNKPGMQASEELDGEERETAIMRWLSARDIAAEWALSMHKLGVHKQIVNRIIEPWCHINVVVTATDWANFFALRLHKDAQPEMRALAEAMWNAQELSTPTLLQQDEWHLPYCSDVHGKRCTAHSDDAIKVSVARCARVSYLTQEGKHPTIEDDLKLYERLVGSTPLHASPAEHQATPDHQSPQGTVSACYVDWAKPTEHGNFHGWRQYRKMLLNENVED